MIFLRSARGIFVITQILEIFFQIREPPSDPAAVASLPHTGSLINANAVSTHILRIRPTQCKAQLSFGLLQSFLTSHVFLGDRGQDETSFICLLNELKPPR